MNTTIEKYSICKYTSRVRKFFRKKTEITCPHEGKKLSPEEIEEMRKKESRANIAMFSAYLEQKYFNYLTFM